MENKTLRVVTQKKSLASLFPELVVGRHEAALIASAEFVMNAGYEEALEKLGSKLQELADWVTENGALVGHMKAAVTLETRSALISTTGDGIRVKPSEYNKASVAMTCIAMLIPDEIAYCTKAERDAGQARARAEVVCRLWLGFHGGEKSG